MIRAKFYILANIIDVLAKKHESMITARQIMDSLYDIFGHCTQIKHGALKFIFNARMKEGTSIQEHVLDMMVQFNMAKMNGAIIDKCC